jgi:hypothetical protein
MAFELMSHTAHVRNIVENLIGLLFRSFAFETCRIQWRSFHCSISCWRQLVPHNALQLSDMAVQFCLPIRYGRLHLRVSEIIKAVAKLGKRAGDRSSEFLSLILHLRRARSLGGQVHDKIWHLEILDVNGRSRGAFVTAW